MTVKENGDEACSRVKAHSAGNVVQGAVTDVSPCSSEQ
jgi:hypothetical protein